jgi:hypothetical protein
VRMSGNSSASPLAPIDGFLVRLTDAVDEYD